MFVAGDMRNGASLVVHAIDDGMHTARKVMAHFEKEQLMANTLTKEDVLKIVEEKQIKFVRFWFTDVLGFLKSFAVTPAELEGAFEEGMGFDGSSIEGFARIEESDMVAWPDPSTFSCCPGAPVPAAPPACSARSGQPNGDPSPATPATC